MEKVYLYSLWNKKFACYEGEVKPSSRRGGGSYFVSDTKQLVCASEPGVVYNGMVWLPEKDNNKAIDLLVQ